MNELYVAIISGTMALLGVALSSFISTRNVRNEKKWERENLMKTKKEELYIRVIKELDIPSVENQYVSSSMFVDITGEELFDIEAQMQLYASKDVLYKYHSSVDANEAELPLKEKERRYDELIKAMKKDLDMEV